MRKHTQLLLAAAFLIAPLHGASVPEPETIFYGKVLNRSGGSEHLLTEGTLTWSLSKPDNTGAPILLSTELEALADGKFSYRLKVPHQALGFELEVGSEALALAAVESQHEHLSISIGGQPARILLPGQGTFDVDQARRASTFRLDLVINSAADDSDADGLPDWWEDQHGLDKQSPDDAGLDGDGDGLDNRAEFRAGSDPNEDNRVPRIVTSELLVYTDGVTGVMLQTIDSDSGREDLHYTITALPAAGTLGLRHPDATPAVAVGTQFTQADLNLGRLVFVHDGALSDANKFSVQVKDENQAHPTSAGTVDLREFQPLEADDPLRFAAALRSADSGEIIWDLGNHSSVQILDLHDSPTDSSLFGSAAADALSGSHQDDLIAGGGGDDNLRGGEGRDQFAITSPEDGNDTIADFNLDEIDALDLSRVLVGSSELLSDYVRVSGPEVALDLDGDGSGFSDMIITLEGNAADLYELLEGEHLIVPDGLSLPPQLRIAAGLANASENGPSASNFTVTRRGNSVQPLVLHLQISGSATNGVDFPLVSPTLTLPAGKSSVLIEIAPYRDALTELDEVVEIVLQQGDGYVLAAGAESARLTIEDLKPEITIEALQGLAVRDTGTAGVFLIRRSEVLDRSVLVQLEIGGTANAGTDYQNVTPFVNFAPGQTTQLVNITPKPGAELDGGQESVRLTIASDPSYRLGENAIAEVSIIEHQTTYATWLDGREASSDLFAQYAFGDSTAKPRKLGGHPAIEFRRSLAASDLVYIIEMSGDLRSWTPGGVRVEDVTLSSAPAARPAGVTLFRTLAPHDSTEDIYFRIRAKLKD